MPHTIGHTAEAIIRRIKAGTGLSDTDATELARRYLTALDERGLIADDASDDALVEGFQKSVERAQRQLANLGLIGVGDAALVAETFRLAGVVREEFPGSAAVEAAVEKASPPPEPPTAKEQFREQIQRTADIMAALGDPRGAFLQRSVDKIAANIDKAILQGAITAADVDVIVNDPGLVWQAATTGLIPEVPKAPTTEEMVRNRVAERFGGFLPPASTPYGQFVEEAIKGFIQEVQRQPSAVQDVLPAMIEQLVASIPPQGQFEREVEEQRRRTGVRQATAAATRAPAQPEPGQLPQLFGRPSLGPGAVPLAGPGVEPGAVTFPMGRVRRGTQAVSPLSPGPAGGQLPQIPAAGAIPLLGRKFLQPIAESAFAPLREKEPEFAQFLLGQNVFQQAASEFMRGPERRAGVRETFEAFRGVAQPDVTQAQLLGLGSLQASTELFDPFLQRRIGEARRRFTAQQRRIAPPPPLPPQKPVVTFR